MLPIGKPVPKRTCKSSLALQVLLGTGLIGPGEIREPREFLQQTLLQEDVAELGLEIPPAAVQWMVRADFFWWFS